MESDLALDAIEYLRDKVDSGESIHLGPPVTGALLAYIERLQRIKVDAESMLGPYPDDLGA